MLPETKRPTAHFIRMTDEHFRHNLIIYLLDLSWTFEA